MNRDAVLQLFGHPKVIDSNGERIAISSRKGIALIAVLAASPGYERSRAWLQNMLWGSRPIKQAQSSLRREITNLRKVLSDADCDLLEADQRSVRLKKGNFRLEPELLPDAGRGLDFLEGIDIPGEEQFEDWLRETRSALGGAEPDTGAKPLEASAPIAARRLKSSVVIVPTQLRFDSKEGRLLAARVQTCVVDTASRFRSLATVIAQNEEEQASRTDANARYSMASGSRYLFRSEVIEQAVGTEVNFALIEMPDQIVRWTETRPIADENRLQLEVGRAINCVLHATDLAEQRRFTNTMSDSEDIPALAARARFHLHQFTPQDFEAARQLIQGTQQSQPANVEMIMLGTHLALWEAWRRWPDAEDAARLRPVVKAALRADPRDARAHLFSGVLETWHGDIVIARSNLKRAIDLNPALSEGLVHLGASYYLAGEPDLAIAPIERALFLNPDSPLRFFMVGELATVLWMQERYREVLEKTLEMRTTHRGYVLADVLQIASLHAMGNRAEARRVAKELDAASRRIIVKMLGWLPFRDEGWRDKLTRTLAPYVTEMSAYA